MALGDGVGNTMNIDELRRSVALDGLAEEIALRNDSLGGTSSATLAFTLDELVDALIKIFEAFSANCMQRRLAKARTKLRVRDRLQRRLMESGVDSTQAVELVRLGMDATPDDFQKLRDAQKGRYGLYEDDE